MAYSAKDLAGEVRRLIEVGIGEGRAVPADRIAATILERHPLPEAATDFVVWCCAQSVRDQVRKALAALRPHPFADQPFRQPTLPGFERLLPAYIVNRPGPDGPEETIVPLALLTVRELTQKADEYQTMALGCMAHAEELRRYRDQRRSLAA